MALKNLIAPPGTSKRSCQPTTFLYGKLFNNNRISDHLDDHQRNKEELTV